MMQVSGLVAQELSIKESQSASTIKLLEQGSTIPFISRYRKEATGGLDEVVVGRIQELWEHYTELQKRKESILSTIEEQGKLSSALRAQINECYDATLLEDLYLPYKPRRRTRATIAREQGLEPLANLIMDQRGADARLAAERFVASLPISEEPLTTELALAGVSDILAEAISEDPQSRATIRSLFSRRGMVITKATKEAIKGVAEASPDRELKTGAKENDPTKYTNYFDFSEPLSRCAPHRLMAMVRGQKQGFLRLGLNIEEPDMAIDALERLFVKRSASSSEREVVIGAIEDGYKRLLRPSIETELLGLAKERADTEAIRVFADNLRQLLLTEPLGEKRILAIDPGFRTGCKVVCLDAQGTLLHNETIYPHPPQSESERSVERIKEMVERYQIEAIAIGDGTAGRQSETLVRSIDFRAAAPQIFMVSEDGASVYSASAVAREEFPDYDLTVRGSVSIGRRLMDPLAELVKIEPKAIGVGQYQHDVDQTQLKRSLDSTVELCVNRVGVNLNTASKHLLTYISGLGPTLARNIVEYRTANGPFVTRRDLLHVPRLGAKAFEQAAGFLRIEGGAEPLDSTGVHPESYQIVKKIASDHGVTVGELITNHNLRQKINLNLYVTPDVGILTLTEIMNEFSNDARENRGDQSAIQFAEGINSINDLQEGMVLPGVVTNITNFGAFVDIGAKQDGLVHISQLANKFVSNPSDIVSLHQQVTVKVMEVDLGRKRIGLSIKALLQD